MLLLVGTAALPCDYVRSSKGHSDPLWVPEVDLFLLFSALGSRPVGCEWPPNSAMIHSPARESITTPW